MKFPPLSKLLKRSLSCCFPQPKLVSMFFFLTREGVNNVKSQNAAPSAEDLVLFRFRFLMSGVEKVNVGAEDGTL